MVHFADKFTRGTIEPYTSPSLDALTQHLPDECGAP